MILLSISGVRWFVAAARGKVQGKRVFAASGVAGGLAALQIK
jgi:hypothetical protein